MVIVEQPVEMVVLVVLDVVTSVRIHVGITV